MKEIQGAFCSEDTLKTERYKNDHAQRLCISLGHMLVLEPVVSFPLLCYYYCQVSVDVKNKLQKC